MPAINGFLQSYAHTRTYSYVCFYVCVWYFIMTTKSDLLIFTTRKSVIKVTKRHITCVPFNVFVCQHIQFYVYIYYIWQVSQQNNKFKVFIKLSLRPKTLKKIL